MSDPRRHLAESRQTRGMGVFSQAQAGSLFNIFAFTNIVQDAGEHAFVR